MRGRRRLALLTLLAAYGAYRARRPALARLRAAFASVSRILSAANTTALLAADVSTQTHQYLLAPPNADGTPLPVPFALRRALRVLSTPEALRVVRALASGAAHGAARAAITNNNANSNSLTTTRINHLFQILASPNAERLVALLVAVAVREAIATCKNTQNQHAPQLHTHWLDTLVVAVTSTRGKQLVIDALTAVTRAAVPAFMGLPPPAAAQSNFTNGTMTPPPPPPPPPPQSPQMQMQMRQESSPAHAVCNTPPRRKRQLYQCFNSPLSASSSPTCSPGASTALYNGRMPASSRSKSPSFLSPVMKTSPIIRNSSPLSSPMKSTGSNNASATAAAAATRDYANANASTNSSLATPVSPVQSVLSHHAAASETSSTPLVERLARVALRDRALVRDVVRAVASEAIRTYLTTQAEIRSFQQRERSEIRNASKEVSESRKRSSASAASQSIAKNCHSHRNPALLLTKYKNSLWKIIVSSFLTDFERAVVRFGTRSQRTPGWIVF